MRRRPEVLVATMVALTFLDLLLMFAVVPLLPVWEEEIGLTKALAGLVLGAYSGATLVASIPAGRLADRIGPRVMTVVASLLLAVSAPLLGVADEVWELVALRFAQGLASAVAWSAGLAWLASSVEGPARARGLAYVNSGAAIAGIGGPVLGGPLAAALGLPAAMTLFGCVTAVVTAVAALLPPPPERHADDRDPGVVETLRRGFADVGLRTALVGIVIVAALQSGVQVLAPLHLDAEGLDQSAIGLVFVAAAITSALATVVMARHRAGHDGRRVILAAIVSAAALLVVLALGPAVPAYITTVVACSVAFSTIYAFGWPLGSERADVLGLGQGTTMGTVNAAWSLTALLVPIGAGALAAAAGDAAAYLAVAAGALVVLAALGRVPRRATPVPGD